MWRTIFVFLFLTELATVQMYNLLSHLNPQLTKLIDAECLIDSNLNSELIDKIELKLVKPNEEIFEKLRCLPLCVFNKLGILYPNGTYNPHPTASIYIRTYTKTTEMINTCTNNSVDACDKANKFTKCILENADTSKKDSNINDVHMVSNKTNDFKNTLNLVKYKRKKNM